MNEKSCTFFGNAMTIFAAYKAYRKLTYFDYIDQLAIVCRIWEIAKIFLAQIEPSRLLCLFEASL